MAKSLGIFVTSPQNWRHVLGVTKAAVNKGSKVKVFFTWKGVHCTKCTEFPELCKIAEVSLCADSYQKEGYDKTNDIPQGLDEKKMSTQSQHAAILDSYDCYMTL